jgi:hypothetical protein
MGDPKDVRAQRLAENEALFRLANERMAEWKEAHANAVTELYFCECANTDCRQKVELRKKDYERARSDSRQFVIAPGHEMPEVETVLERHEGWELISKDERVQETVEALDPRNDV